MQGYRFEPPPQEEGKVVRLYNIDVDPRERQDLASQHPQIVDRIMSDIQNKWLNRDRGYRRPQINIPLPAANPRYHNWTWAPFRLL